MITVISLIIWCSLPLRTMKTKTSNNWETNLGEIERGERVRDFFRLLISRCPFKCEYGKFAPQSEQIGANQQ